MLQLKQVISKPTLPPPPRPVKDIDSQNYQQLRKQYRIRRASALDFPTISSGNFLGAEEIAESSSRSRRHHSQPDMEMDNEKPNKLSEEVIKCLISVYLKLNKASLESKGSSNAVVKQSLISSKKPKSSFICKTSLNCTTAAAAAAPTFTFNDYASNLDPYGILLDTDGSQREIGSYKNFIQVSRTSLNTSHISECLPEMGKLRYFSRLLRTFILVNHTTYIHVVFSSCLKFYRSMVHKLSNVDITYLSYKQKLAFWINVYNVCIMHVL